ncbi:DNA/RNA non-specific endonuclease [Pusillimonas sp. NJUB218]|uniref:DNA/RNA non-specific endonuclease n=1 Tax=Pusillimonas sp. NJUB218 TaxID=2023230 RepID=UPI000F4C1C07|nr:DNA/RNA non-specific endonuclease [Pusillimonas sp. NJUB218]ROT44719.1 endonuclease [Pusillimonas sp. NJUB218]
MATRRSSKRKTSRKPSNRKSLRLLLTSTAASFAFFTTLFNPQLAHLVGLEHFDIGRVATTVASQPPVATKSGLIQTSFKDCPQFFPGKPPAVPAATGLRELCFSSFAILHSGQTKTPVFVAQRLNRKMLEQAKSVERQDRFYEEGRLPATERAKLDDYRGSGYARGHMAPAADMHTPDAMTQSFSLANIVPQDQRQNSGPWNKIEEDTRKYIMRAKGDVYVFTGPVYANNSQRIGAGRVAVPTHLFKVVYDATTKRSWVHWQENGPDAIAGRPISYDEFILRTELRLFHVTSG